MWIAAIGGIQGDVHALEAVFNAIDAAGIHTILNTGNCAAGEQHPNEVIDLLRERSVISVQGLTDRYIAHFQRKQDTLRRKHPNAFESVRAAFQKMRTENIEYLNGLPALLTKTFEGIILTLCHGMPSTQNDGLSLDDDIDRFRRERERLPETRIVVCGQTPAPFARWVDDVLFVNPGRMRDPRTGKARYTLIDTELAPWEARLIEVISS